MIILINKFLCYVNFYYLLKNKLKLYIKNDY